MEDFRYKNYELKVSEKLSWAWDVPKLYLVPPTPIKNSPLRAIPLQILSPTSANQDLQISGLKRVWMELQGTV